MNWKWPAQHVGWKALWDRYKYILLVILAGVLLLLLPGGQTEPTQHTAAQQPEGQFDLERMEKKLEHALAQIQGAGEVTVVLKIGRAHV